MFERLIECPQNMFNLSPEEKKEILANAFQRIAALTFPENENSPIHILFGDKETLKRGVYCLQDYIGTGFSFIIEAINTDTITLKIYEIDTDELYICAPIVVKTNSVERYIKNPIKIHSFMLGLIEIESGTTKIYPVSGIAIALQSVSVS